MYGLTKVVRMETRESGLDLVKRGKRQSRHPMTHGQEKEVMQATRAIVSYKIFWRAKNE